MAGKSKLIDLLPIASRRKGTVNAVPRSSLPTSNRAVALRSRSTVQESSRAAGVPAHPQTSAHERFWFTGLTDDESEGISGGERRRLQLLLVFVTTNVLFLATTTISILKPFDGEES